VPNAENKLDEKAINESIATYAVVPGAGWARFRFTWLMTSASTSTLALEDRVWLTRTLLVSRMRTEPSVGWTSSLQKKSADESQTVGLVIGCTKKSMFVAVAEDVFIWSVAAQRKVDSFNCTLEMLLLTYLID